MRSLAIFVMFALAAAPLAAEPALVADLHPGPNTEAQPAGLPMAGGEVVYFPASDPAHGVELWRTDGTPEGTWRLTDVCPGRCNSDPWPVVVFQGRPYFSADDGASGRELWQSDGTPGSERRVRDLCPGPCHSDPAALTVLDGRLLFVASVGPHRSLWSSNGTRRGTVPLKEICTFPLPEPLAGSDCPWFPGLQKAGGLVYFGLTSLGGNFDLWRSDGTAEGTWSLRSLLGNVAIAEASFITPLGDAGLAWARDGLWRTDGTSEGTSRLASMAELTADGENTSYPYRIEVWNGLLFTVLEDGELIRSDGTPQGTFRIGKFHWGYDVLELTPSASGLLFRVTTDGPQEGLWRTQGTAETTEKLSGVAEGRSIGEMAPLGDLALFYAWHPEWSPGGTTLELWATDGTPAGTRLLLGDAGKYQAYDGIAAMGGRAWFYRGTEDYLAPELWTTDGTAEGTAFLHDFNAGPGSSGPLDQAAFNGRLVFSARTSKTDVPLFESDGTAAGTRELSREAAWAGRFTPFGDLLYFSSTLGLSWLNRASVLDGDPKAAGFRSPMPLGSTLLFGAQLGGSFFGYSDIELWRSDGTVRGTRSVKNIDRASIYTGFHHACVGESSDPGPGARIGGAVVFAAEDGRNGRELWRTDGTAAGTRLLLDIRTGKGPWEGDECDPRTTKGLSSSPGEFLAYRGGALFAADDGTSGRELWWTDGTAAGTRRVKDLRRGAEGSDPHRLTLFRGKVYFFARRGAAGEALWRTDGTAAGTVMIDDLTVGGAPSWPRDLTVVRQRLFFSVYNEATGSELWTSRGDAASTGLVTDLRPGTPGSSPQAFTVAGGLLVFAADDGEHGLEAWRSDGTAAGTRRVADLNPGRDASSPGPFSLLGDVLLTGVDDGEHGRELWAIPVSDVIDP